jgi:hypothetical protein
LCQKTQKTCGSKGLWFIKSHQEKQIGLFPHFGVILIKRKVAGFKKNKNAKVLEKDMQKQGKIEKNIWKFRKKPLGRKRFGKLER